MTDHKDNPAEIYLVPDAEHGHVWSDDPAPGEGMREEDATRYVRADLVPESNEVLARRVVELTETVIALRNQLAAKPSDSGYAKLQAAHDALKAQVEQLRGGLNQAIELLVTALHEPLQITEPEIHDLRTLEKLTPAQCLAEHEADIRQKTVEPILSKLRAANGETTHPRARVYLCEEALELCLVEINKINQLRQQAKVGE